MTPSPAAPTVHLSLVIPVYNEGRRIPQTLPQILDFLNSRPQRSEALLVDDGSTDHTAELAQSLCPPGAPVRLLRHPANRGKGAAVRTGMLAAQGEYLLFSDADLSSPLSEADRLLGPLQEGYDVVIGSRALRREWITVRQSPLRETAGKIFNLLLRRITGLNFQDTQCGFKAFRRRAAQAIFSAQTIPGFGFDAEILYLAQKFGYRSLEVPVHWAHSEGTKVHMIRDSFRMFSDLVRIRWNDWRGRYRLPAGKAPGNGPPPG